MKSFKFIAVLGLITISSPALASGAVEHSAHSAAHSAQGVSHAASAAIKLTSGATAVPLMWTGSTAESIGQSVGQSGQVLMNSASGALPLSSDIVTVVTPPSLR